MEDLAGTNKKLIDFEVYLDPKKALNRRAAIDCLSDQLTGVPEEKAALEALLFYTAVSNMLGCIATKRSINAINLCESFGVIEMPDKD